MRISKTVGGVNSRGDVEYIYNINGELVTRYIYDSWGKLIEIQNHTTSADHIGNVNSVRYRGYYYDQETGLYYTMWDRGIMIRKLEGL